MENQPAKDRRAQQDSLPAWLFRLLKGAIIGVGAILPGISGGVLCVIFGIYQPLMSFLAHPIKSFRSHWRFLLPVLIGFLVGILALARVVEWLFRTSPTPAVWLFIGLIVGTFPSLFQEAGQRGRGKGAWISFSVSLVCMLALMLWLNYSGGTAVTPNVFWWLFCGALWGVGLVVPGLSPSSFFIFFGLYQPMTAGISNLDLSIVIPLVIGLVVTIVLLARLVKRLFDRHYRIMYHVILGIVVASTIAIIPIGNAQSFGDIVIYALCFVIGAGLAFGMDRVGKHWNKKKQGIHSVGDNL
jgi:putative membrane protein